VNPLAIGDVVQSSALERAWAAAPKGHAVVPRRRLEYDTSNVLFYSPISYDYAPIQPAVVEPPMVEWIADRFRSFVLGQREGGSTRGDCPMLGSLVRAGYVSDGIIDDYLRNSGEESVYGGLLDDVLHGGGLGAADRITQLLCHRQVGSPKNSAVDLSAKLHSHVADASKAKLPLRFVVPAFPFKDQNPFRTGRNTPASHVDFGELALVARLHALALAISQVHPYGAEWIIVSDGVTYAPIFAVPEEEARRYRLSLQDFRNRLNLQNTLHFLDLSDMASRLPNFSALVEDIEGKLRKLTATGDDAERLEVLARGISWNLSTREYLDEYEPAELWSVLTSSQPSAMPHVSERLRTEIVERSRNAAIRYAAFNMAFSHVQLLERFLPGAIRATVHPKPGQVALPRLGDVYPWNGVGVRTPAAGNVVIESREYFSFARQRWSAARLYSSEFAFYYELLE